MQRYELSTLDYSNSLSGCYQSLSDLPGFVLLQSSDSKRGRYDILSAYPYERVLITEESVNIAEKLRQLSTKLYVEESELDLPFQGGAIGYIAYDLAARLHMLSSPVQKSLEGMPLLDLGFYDWAIIVDHLEKRVTLFSANRYAETIAIVKQVKELWLQNNQVKKESMVENFVPLISQQEYQDAFFAIQQALIQGRSYQVNLTQPFHAPYTGDCWQIYLKVIAANPVPFSAFLRSSHGTIISFSPERFLSYKDGKLSTSPIKGTIARSDNPIEDALLKNRLLESEKNRAENVMIVDLLRNDLGKIAKAGSVQFKYLCEVQSYHSLHHLVSEVEAMCLDTVQPFEAFLSCFPGGSITGAPKLEAMRIIAEQERYARGVYCGSIGYFSQHGRFDTNIAIRTLTAREGILHLAAGGGIVIDSHWEDEYRECYTKIAAIIYGIRSK